MIDGDDKDPPIEPQQFLGGVKVVDFGDIRVARGLSRRPFTQCRHIKLVYDKQERRIWCQDCEKNLDGFDAFEALVANMDSAHRHFDRMKEEALEARDHNLHLIAAKNLEKVWRGRTLAPACPHCQGGLLPEDFSRPCGGVSAEIERARRERAKKK